MKTLRLAAPFALLAAVAVAADVPPVVAPATRTASLATAKQLLAAKDGAAPANLADPFHSEAFTEFASTAGTAAVGNTTAGPSGSAVAGAGSTARSGGPRNARDLLAAIGDALKPSGYIVMGGQPSLSFGQKRVKPGGTLTITFEGAEYTVEVTAIDRANFTLRLNNEEYTRPIKK